MDGCLHRAGMAAIDRSAVRRQAQVGFTTITLATAARNDPSVLQTTEDPRQGARVQLEDRRELPGRCSRTTPEDPHNQALRPGDPQFGFHPLGSCLESVTDAPDQTHELEDIPEHQAVATYGGSLLPTTPLA